MAALAGGAAHVLNLDMSRAALSRGRDNHRLNGHDLGKVGFLGHDLFKSWGKVISSGPFDLVIIDPPSFQKGSFLLSKDYQRVLRRLPELLSADGLVLACMNDPAVGSDFLIDGVTREAPGMLFERRLDNPPEFPDIDTESGLKALLFKQGAILPEKNRIHRCVRLLCPEVLFYRCWRPACSPSCISIHLCSRPSTARISSVGECS